MRYRSGILLGSWLVANVVAYRLLVRSGWPFGADAPDVIRVDPFAMWPQWLTAAAIALAFLVPSLAVAVWLYFERSTRIDQHTVAAASRWCVRALTTPASAGVVAAVLLLLLLPAFHDAFWLAAVPAVVLTVLLPFGVFDVRVAASSTGQGWWRPRWPGFKPLLAVVTLFALLVAIEWVAAAVAAGFPPAAPFIYLGEGLLGMVAIAVGGLILLFRLSPADAVACVRGLLSWQRLGPIAAVHARLMFVSAFVAVPVVTGAVVLWQVIPLHAAWAESRGAVLPRPARALATLGMALEGSGLFIASFLLGLPFLLMVARVLWLTSHPPHDAAAAG